MFPPEVIHALKDALKHAYWYKDDLRAFFLACDVPHKVITRQAWHDPQQYKIRIISAVVEELLISGDPGLGALRRMAKRLIELPNLDHLRRLEDGTKKVATARKAIDYLTTIAGTYDASLKRDNATPKRAEPEKAVNARRLSEELSKLHEQFMALVATSDPNKRGYLFEKFLYELFVLHDLNPRGAFKITGEQIDGAFEFDNTQFLLEAKWEKNPLPAEPIDVFCRKIERKLDNTLGLFVSLNGFSDDALQAIRGNRPSAILMDGQDLAVVLQGIHDFRELLKQKIRHAAHTGDPFLRAMEV